MEKIPVDTIIQQLDSYYSKENFKNAKELINFWSQTAIKFDDFGAELTLENELIGLVRRTGEEMEGRAAIDRALGIIRDGKITDELAIATTRLNCATTLEAFGDFESALPLYKKSEEIYAQILKPEDPRFGGLYNNMAFAYMGLGSYEEAEKLLKKAVDIMKKNGSFSDAAVSLVSLAEVYEKMAGALESTSGKEELLPDGRDVLFMIDDCLMRAYDLLNDEANIRNADYAYSLRKCISGYGHFGYNTIKKELEHRADMIYEGYRAF